MSKGYYQLKPCPVCDSTSGKCRGKEDSGKEYILCMSLADAKKGHIENGYKCIKEASTSYQHYASTFILDNSQEWSEEQQREWETRKLLRKAEERLQEQAKRERCLTADERHAFYSKILDSLKLDIPTVVDLKKRGFTQDEINSCEFKTVEKWHKLPFAVNKNLPGIGAKGNSLIVSGEGYLCPIRDYDSRVVALQLRLHNPDNSSRYRWVSSEHQTLALKVSDSLENPLAVFKPVGKPAGIALVEGTGAKPYLTSKRLNKIVIGAAGGQFAGSPKLLEEYLSRASQDTNTKELEIYVDAGDIANKSVMLRWEQIAKLVSDFGYDVKFAWWGQATKDACDIDELDDYSSISYITTDKFLAIVEEHQSDKVHTYSYNESASDWAWQKWIKSRKYTPDIVVNQKEFEFPQIPDSNAIIAVKSGLGTGKTKAIIRLMKFYAYTRSMVVGYRNNLLFQTGSRAALEYLTLYHLREDDGINMLADVHTNLLFCLDSIHHVDGYFTGVDLYIDEIVSVISHAISGGTLGGNQAKALAIFTRALNVCNRVFILDGNLSDRHADFIAKLAPGKQLIKIENKYKISPHTIKIVDGITLEGKITKRDKSALLKAMFDREHRPWIACDSKKQTKILDKLFKKAGKRGYVINSETVGEDWAKQFLDNPDKFIEDNQPDYFIVSPSCESGISVTLKGYFSAKFTFLCGVQGTNSQHQMMFRLRDDSIPHYVFCPEKSMIKDRNVPQTYCVNKFKEIIDNRIKQSLDFIAVDSDEPKLAVDTIVKALDRNDQIWWDFACESGTLDNFEMENLRKCLTHVLPEAGHNAEIITWETDEGFNQKAKEAKEEIQLEHAQEIFTAVEYESIDEAKRISKANQRKETQRRVEKTLLLERLPEIEDTEVYSTDFILQCHIKDPDFINKQQRFYLLNNFEISQKRHESNWYYEATKEDFFIARVKQTSHSTIWALKELNILQFLKGEWYKDSPEVIECIQKARTPEIITALGRQPKSETVSGQERIEFISSLLATIGIKFKKQRQETKSNGIRYRIYSVDHEAMEDSYRLAILAAVERKLTQWMQEKSQIKWSDALTDETVAATETNPEVLSLAEKLAQAETKIRCDELFLSVSEEQKQQAWELLTAEQQAKIWQFYPSQQKSQSLTGEQELTSASGQETVATAIIETSERSPKSAVMSNESEVKILQIVDTAIATCEPLCDLEALPTETKWRRRLGRALILGADSAKKIYQLVPSQILQTVWQGLTQGVQNSYIQLFEVGNYG